MTITSMFSESVALSFTVTAASTATAPSATSGSQSCSTGSSCDDEDSARISPKAQALSKHSSDPSAKADDILEALDADEDGSVSKQEFSDNASQVMGELSRAGRHGRHHGLTLDKLFSRLDTNGDGAIDHDELGAAVDKASRSRDTSASTGTEAPAASLSFSATLVVSVTAIVQYSKASEEDTSPSSTGTQVNATA